MITFILITLMTLHACGAIAVVANTGKPRAPITSSTAVAVVILASTQIAGLLYVLAANR